MVNIINNLKNFLLNKSNQYLYYKSGYAQLKKDIILKENELKNLDLKIEENKQLKQDNAKLKKHYEILNRDSGAHYPGHFYSPINNYEFVKNRKDDIWKTELIKDIKLNDTDQLDLLKSFTKYHHELPFKSNKQSNLRYYFENDYFEHADGTILYSMIRTMKPKRIIEIGSGFSSALMMDVNNLFFENKIKLTFIEPYPERLYSLMKDKDTIKNEILTEIVQDVNLEKFKELEPNDILFIDSSHVVKAGNDVQHILFEILPILKSGVYIHFHDVFYPFQYPKKWILDNRWNWNEDYFLRAFLMYNNQFEIVLFPTYLYKYHTERFNSLLDIPVPNNNNNIDEPYQYQKGVGASIWLKKI